MPRKITTTQTSLSPDFSGIVGALSIWLQRQHVARYQKQIAALEQEAQTIERELDRILDDARAKKIIKNLR